MSHTGEWNAFGKWNPAEHDAEGRTASLVADARARGEWADGHRVVFAPSEPMVLHVCGVRGPHPVAIVIGADGARCTYLHDGRTWFRYYRAEDALHEILAAWALHERACAERAAAERDKTQTRLRLLHTDAERVIAQVAAERDAARAEAAALRARYERRPATEAEIAAAVEANAAAPEMAIDAVMEGR